MNNSSNPGQDLFKLDELILQLPNEIEGICNNLP